MTKEKVKGDDDDDDDGTGEMCKRRVTVVVAMVVQHTPSELISTVQLPLFLSVTKNRTVAAALTQQCASFI